MISTEYVIYNIKFIIESIYIIQNYFPFLLPPNLKTISTHPLQIFIISFLNLPNFPPPIKNTSILDTTNKNIYFYLTINYNTFTPFPIIN